MKVSLNDIKSQSHRRKQVNSEQEEKEEEKDHSSILSVQSAMQAYSITSLFFSAISFFPFIYTLTFLVLYFLILLLFFVLTFSFASYAMHYIQYTREANAVHNLTIGMSLKIRNRNEID